eukprot:4669206-Pyramimonas_sp.AAC.1
MIRVFGLDYFDSVVLGPNTTLDVYIDDSGLNAVGTAEQLVTSPQDGAPTLQHAITVMMRAQISLGKTAMVSSSKFVSHRLSQ